eukprot:GILJ01003234.1.p1 GENE.GILJ01003234.1~~GILJ01003234.1.p1  ORF type:complete len:442 (-),score=66.12 GILJ01003234.1:260-1432(-)
MFSYKWEKDPALSTPETQKEVHRLRYQCLEFADELLKQLCNLDEVTGDAEVKAVRKSEVHRAQNLLTRIDRLKEKVEKMEDLRLSGTKAPPPLIPTENANQEMDTDDVADDIPIAATDTDMSGGMQELNVQESSFPAPSSTTEPSSTESQPQRQQPQQHTAAAVQAPSTSAEAPVQTHQEAESKQPTASQTSRTIPAQTLSSTHPAQQKKQKGVHGQREIPVKPVTADTNTLPRWEPRWSSHESRGAYHVDMELPGMKRSDITVLLEEDGLRVSGVRVPNDQDIFSSLMHAKPAYGRFDKVFQLPQDVDSDNISAHYEHGILRITMPKVKPSQHPVPHGVGRYSKQSTPDVSFIHPPSRSQHQHHPAYVHNAWAGLGGGFGGWDNPFSFF